MYTYKIFGSSHADSYTISHEKQFTPDQVREMISTIKKSEGNRLSTSALALHLCGRFGFQRHRDEYVISYHEDYLNL